jgi:hypothetical protein
MEKEETRKEHSPFHLIYEQENIKYRGKIKLHGSNGIYSNKINQKLES